MIAVATPADRERVLGTLVPAFVEDPVLRYMFPDDADYPVQAAAFFGHLFDKRVGRRAIWIVDGGSSVAIWEPPPTAGALPPTAGALPPTAGALPASSVRVRSADPISSAGSAPDAVSEPDAGFAGVFSGAALGRVLAYDSAVHAVMPVGPYWYLGVLGTRPEQTGRGWGRAVMAEGLRRAAADGLPAVLETSKPANVEFYERAGWRVVGVAASPVPTWVMQQGPAAGS
ncbi:GNAT family N-acetyltransferase [Actinoplanes sp. NBRC 101535]|uniref:GNAT family N-acetyltransferase n=1 Tax=Actinoplanes sp. NBRC 101535 TaxID=3032196 RepID=UPI0024A1D93A|nr:GNAT family N-acetyltransferase [Actinoplanes sp. NBRC 101535]GLX99927.1 hypothetical protein Acsp01_03070 [Actinoplanes sp. NBRC 101535]